MVNRPKDYQYKCNKQTAVAFVGPITATVIISITLPDLHYTLAVVALVLVRFTRQPAH